MMITHFTGQLINKKRVSPLITKGRENKSEYTEIFSLLLIECDRYRATVLPLEFYWEDSAATSISGQVSASLPVLIA